MKQRNVGMQKIVGVLLLVALLLTLSTPVFAEGGPEQSISPSFGSDSHTTAPYYF